MVIRQICFEKKQLKYAYKTQRGYTETMFPREKKSPLEISRSKVELFTQCPRCFYLDKRFNVRQPSMPPFFSQQHRRRTI